MKKFLITGFEPFLNHTSNPSWDLAQSLSSHYNNSESICLPVEYEEAFIKLKAKVIQSKPTHVVCFGLAADRKTVNPELIAINHNHSSALDNKGVLIKDSEILKGGTVAFKTRLPIYKMSQMASVSFAWEVSYSAGSYVCNDLYYRLLHWEYSEPTRFMSVFIHIPLVDMKSLAGKQLLESCVAAIDCL